MQYTENYAFRKPQYGEDGDVDDMNYNSDSIDSLIHQTRSMVSDGYESAQTYNKGELCIYSNVLYKCKEDGTTGTWDANKWEATDLATEVSAGNMPPITAEAEGNPIELSDAASAPMVRCETEIQGSQDLHGYDKPWVGGAGKNKLPLVLADIKSANTSGTWNGNAYTISDVTLTILTDDNGNITGIKANGTATSNITFRLTFSNASYMTDGMTYKISGSIGGSYSTWCIWVESHGTIRSEMSLDGDGTFTYTSGQPQRANLSIDSGVTVTNQMFYPMLRLATESDQTFTPYSNICPITAYTEGEIEVRGKNQLPYTLESLKTDNTSGTWSGNTYSFHNVSFKVNTDENGNVVGIETSGTANANTTFYVMKDSNGSEFNGMTLNGCSGGSSSTYYLAFGENSSPYREFVDTGSGVDISGLESKVGWRFYIYIANGKTANTTFYPMLRFTSDKDSTFEPYTSTTHTTTYPSAIYRGSEDVVNGEVTSEKVKIKVSDLEWTYNSQYARFGSNISDMFPWAAARIGFILSDSYETINDGRPITNVPAYCIYNGGGVSVFIYDARYTDVTAFVNDMGDSEIVFQLQNPTTTPVTPTNLPIRTLSGYNHIESSTGDMEIEYYTQDWQKIIDLIEKESGGGSSYSETTLWSGSEEPSVSGTEIDLSDRVSNYDAICLYAEKSGTCGDCTFTVSNLTIGNTYIKDIYGEDYFGVYWNYVSDTKIKIMRIASAHAVAYKKIIGIKY